MALLLRIVRIVCYAAFVLIGGAILLVVINESLSLCTGFSANSGLTCGGVWYEGLFNAAMGLVLVSLVALVPAVLALAGLIFALIDLSRWLRRRAASRPE